MSFSEKVSHMLDFSWEAMDAPLFSSLIIMAILLILAIIVGILAKHADPLKTPRGLLFLVTWAYDKIHAFVIENMGEAFENYTGYFMCLIPYLGLSFIWGLTGLPSVIDYLAAPLSLSVIMFVLIHATAIRWQKWHYFSRYVEPFAVFLPINLISMWTPIISTSMRMFGNCLSGTIIIGLVQWALSNLAASLFASFTPAGLVGIFLAPIPMGILNLYFSLFSAFIQTTVFTYLTALWIAAEKPVEESIPGAVGVLAGDRA